MKERELQKQQAQENIKRLIAEVDANPYDEHAYYNLGAYLTKLKSYPQAEELFKRALNVFEKQPQRQDILHYGLGNVYYASELYAEAIQEFQVVKDDQLKGDAFLMMAQAYYAQSDYQKALAFAMTASDQLTDQTPAATLMGNIFVALGDFTHAQEYFLQVVNQHGDDLEALFGLGLVDLAQGKDDNQYFIKVKQLDPAFYQKKEAKLADIERFLQMQAQKDQTK